MLLWWWHRPGAAQYEKRRELQAYALPVGPASPIDGTQDKEPRPGWARLSGLVPSKKFAGFQEERLPARAGKTSKRKIEKNKSEHIAFRNCRIYRRSRGDWREKISGRRRRRFAGKRPPRPPGGHPGAAAGHSSVILMRAGRIVFHAMENFSRNFPRYGNFFRDFSTVWKTFCDFFHAMEKISASFPRYGKLFSTQWKTG